MLEKQETGFCTRPLTEKTIRKLHQACKRKLGDFEIPFETFSEAMQTAGARKLEDLKMPSGKTPRGLGESLHPFEIYLSLGCAGGSEKAWRVFKEAYSPLIHGACRLLTGSGDSAGSFLRDIYGELFFPSGQGPERYPISGYQGECSLQGWLLSVLPRMIFRSFPHAVRARSPYHAIPSVDRRAPSAAGKRKSPPGLESRKELRARIRGLSPVELLAFLLRFFYRVPPESLGYLERAVQRRIVKSALKAGNSFRKTSEKDLPELLRWFLERQKPDPGTACPGPSSFPTFLESEMAADKSRAFVLHLTGCTKCQREMALQLFLGGEGELDFPSLREGAGAAAAPRRRHFSERTRLHHVLSAAIGAILLTILTLIATASFNGTWFFSKRGSEPAPPPAGTDLAEQAPARSIPPQSKETVNRIQLALPAIPEVDGNHAGEAGRSEDSALPPEFHPIGTLAGSVSDEYGLPLPRARIAVKNMEGKTVLLLTADKNGNYAMRKMPAGFYTLVGESKGFLPQRVPEISVAPGTTTTINFVLALNPRREKR